MRLAGCGRREGVACCRMPLLRGPSAWASHQGPQQMMSPVCKSHLVVRVTVGFSRGTVHRLLPVTVSRPRVAFGYRLSTF